MFWRYLFLTIAIPGIALLCFFNFGNAANLPLSDNLGRFSADYQVQRDLCLRFVETKMTTKSGGITANFLDEPKVSEINCGHQILSESEGLIMLFYAVQGDQAKFDKHLRLIKKKMLIGGGLFRWRIAEDNLHLTECSATIDDLRIIRALFHAYRRWNNPEYYRMAVIIQKALLKWAVLGDRLTDFYDFKANSRAEAVTLSYLDLYTMKLLIKVDRHWRPIYDRSLRLLEQGFLSKQIPLYHKVFRFTDNYYLKDTDINLIDSLLVALHLSEVGKLKKETAVWLRRKIIDDGILYLSYDLYGKATSHDVSTAVYALAARIARNTDDKQLYHAAIQKMIQLQVKESSSIIYGAFGDPRTLTVYSFDNLEALLTF